MRFIHLKTYTAPYNYPDNKKLCSSCWITLSIQRAGDKRGARVCTAQEVWFNYSLWLQQHNINKGWGGGWNKLQQWSTAHLTRSFRPSHDSYRLMQPACLRLCHQPPQPPPILFLLPFVLQCTVPQHLKFKPQLCIHTTQSTWKLTEIKKQRQEKRERDRG